MQQALRRSCLVPPGFAVESAVYEAERTVITVRPIKSFGLCPSCGAASRRVHSHYRPRVADLPLAGRSVQLVLVARRFRCDAVLCGRQIFTERFADVGIDDWAWRRNQRYGSIICNLERRRVVRLLPDREPATAQAWFAGHPAIAIIARDRGGGYGEAAAKALPHAVQVADRWHLMENASRAFLDAVRKSMRQIRSAIGATTINPELLTAAERIQYEGYLRREETNATILALSKDGMPIKHIVRQTGHSRKMVRQVIRGERNDVFRVRQSSLDVHLPWLDD